MRNEITVHWLGREIPHKEGSNQWWYAATMQSMDGMTVPQICSVIERFEIAKVGYKGSPRRAIWHKAGWESKDSGKEMPYALVELRYADKVIHTKSQFLLIERSLVD